MKNHMMTGAIVSTFHPSRMPDTIRCLKSLQNQTVMLDEILLVLEPNASLIQKYSNITLNGVNIIVSEGPGLSNARNTGIKHSKADILLFIDDDAYAKEDWIYNILKNFQDPRVVCVGGIIFPNPKNIIPPWFPEEVYWIIGCSYLGLPKNKQTILNPIGCNMAFKKNIFNNVGLFSNFIGRKGNNLLGSEEYEFSMRLKAVMPDKIILFDPSSIVYHNVNPKRLSWEYFIKRSFFEGYSKVKITQHGQIPKEYLGFNYLYATFYSGVLNPFFHLNMKKIPKMTSIMVSVIFVGLGFIYGKLKK
jgi:cellulose synthase/poly-beta-1,6-N-acetylglucosamine synthase-like glycosyltransferase